MVYILLALVLFVIALIVHLLHCRTTTASGLQAKAFIFSALTCWGVYWALSLYICRSGLLDAGSLLGMPLVITAGVIFILLVPIYLCFYVLTQLVSPSKKILSTITQAGESTYDGILAAVEQENFVGSRLDDLLASGCVRIVDGRYVLTPHGGKIAGILKVMQMLLGRKAGG